MRSRSGMFLSNLSVSRKYLFISDVFSSVKRSELTNIIQEREISCRTRKEQKSDIDCMIRRVVICIGEQRGARARARTHGRLTEFARFPGLFPRKALHQ